MSVAELNTHHTICVIERHQFLTTIAISVKNPQIAVFLLTQTRSNFLYVESSTTQLLAISYLYRKLNNVMTKSPLTISKLSCMLTLLLVKPLNMLIKPHAKTTHKTLLLSTLTPIYLMS